MFCLCFAVSAFLSGNWKSHQIVNHSPEAKCSLTAQIAILRFCKTPLFVGGLAGGEVSSAVRCPRILSQICKPQICKTNWFGKFLPMHVCNFFTKSLYVFSIQNMNCGSYVSYIGDNRLMIDDTSDISVCNAYVDAIFSLHLIFLEE